MSTNIHDAAVSMLPDLSENLSNEERTWEEIMQIKAMPVCMAQKIQLKNHIRNIIGRKRIRSPNFVAR